MKTKLLTMLAALAAAFLVIAPTESSAATVGVVDYDDTITAIYGTGNPDGSWTSATNNGKVAALRFRQRFSTNMTNDGSGTYFFALGTEINLDFSLNSGTSNLSKYDYLIGLDDDPSPAVDYTPITFNPFLLLDNSYGNSGTANGAGVEGIGLLALVNKVAQNSQQLSTFGIDTSISGEYTSFRRIQTKGSSPRIIAETEVKVIIGDRPPTKVHDSGSTFAFGAFALGGLVVAKRRQTKSTAQAAKAA